MKAQKAAMTYTNRFRIGERMVEMGELDEKKVSEIANEIRCRPLATISQGKVIRLS